MSPGPPSFGPGELSKVIVMVIIMLELVIPIIGMEMEILIIAMVMVVKILMQMMMTATLAFPPQSPLHRLACLLPLITWSS